MRCSPGAARSCASRGSRATASCFPSRPSRSISATARSTCPNGQVQGFSFGTVVEFDPDVCDRCPLRAQCTTAELGNGRSVAIAENEQLQQRLRKQIQHAPPGAKRSASARRSNTSSPTSRNAKAITRATSASARTPSTSVARARSKTWRHSIGQKSIRKRRRNDVTFKPFGVLAPVKDIRLAPVRGRPWSVRSKPPAHEQNGE